MLGARYFVEQNASVTAAGCWLVGKAVVRERLLCRLLLGISPGEEDQMLLLLVIWRPSGTQPGSEAQRVV